MGFLGLGWPNKLDYPGKGWEGSRISRMAIKAEVNWESGK